MFDNTLKSAVNFDIFHDLYARKIRSLAQCAMGKNYSPGYLCVPKTIFLAKILEELIDNQLVAMTFYSQLFIMEVGGSRAKIRRNLIAFVSFWS